MEDILRFMPSAFTAQETISSLTRLVRQRIKRNVVDKEQTKEAHQKKKCKLKKIKGYGSFHKERKSIDQY